MSPDLRIPFVLNFIYELPYPEIAKRCGISLVNVRKRIQLAHSELKLNLKAIAEGRISEPTASKMHQLLDTETDPSKGALAGGKSELRAVCIRLPNGLSLNYHLFIDESFGKPSQIPALKKYVSKHPKGWKKQLALAQAYELAGNWQDAVKNYRACLEKKPNNPSIALRMAHLLELAGHGGETERATQSSAEMADDSGLILKGQSLCPTRTVKPRGYEKLAEVLAGSPLLPQSIGFH